MIFCCVCGHGRKGEQVSVESTDLPGGWRCVDRQACRARVRAIIKAHKDLAKAVEGIANEGVYG